MALLPDEAVDTALEALISPVVKFCVGYGIKLKTILAVLKRCLVVEAKRSQVSAGKEVSVSQVSLMTGVHRLDATKLIHGEEAVPKEHDLVKRVIGLWRSARRYCTRAGEPKPLTFKGRGSEFAKLVAEVSHELSPYTVLKELERIGATSNISNLLVLQTFEYVPKRSLGKGLHLLGGDIDDLILAATDNLLAAPTIPQLHLKTEFDNLPPSQIDLVKRWLLGEGADFHQRARKFLSELDRDVSPKPEAVAEVGRLRVAVGTFSVAQVASDSIKRRSGKK